MGKILLTTNETAEYLGVTPKEVRRLADEEYLKPAKGFRKPFKFNIFELCRYSGVSFQELEAAKAGITLRPRRNRTLTKLRKNNERIQANRIKRNCIVRYKKHTKPEIVKKDRQQQMILTTQQAAKLLSVSDWEIRRLTDEGYLKRLRGYRKPYKFSKYVIDRYLGK